jgi:hypothetical protein
MQLLLAVPGQTVEEEKRKQASVVETLGTASWANIAANVTGRNENQCSSKWQYMSRKATATRTVRGAWTLEEEQKLASAVETLGTTSWAKIDVNIPGRNEIQCSQKWRRMPKKAAATSSGAWTVEEEKKLVYSVETLGTTGWAKVAANVPGRSDTQCSNKWQKMSQMDATTASGVWTVEEVNKLASAVATFGTTRWANVAANVPGRSEQQCNGKWQKMREKAGVTSSSTWAVEEINKLVSAVATFGTTSWIKLRQTFRGEVISNATTSGITCL